MRIQKFEQFDPKNEGLRSAASIVSLLIGLGLGRPDAILANQDRIESSIDLEEEHVLHLIDYMQKNLPGDTIFNKRLPISYLADSVSRYTRSKLDIDLNLERAIKTMQQPGFPVKIDLFFVNVGKQVPITTIEYQQSDRITFTLTKNDVWDRYTYGIKVRF